VIETGLSDHNAQILQVQMHYKNKKGQGKINEEFRIARSYRERGERTIFKLSTRKGDLGACF
jgi:hypothetical protein